MTAAERIMKKKAHIKAEMDRAMPKAQSDELWRAATEKLDSILVRYAALPKGVRMHTDKRIFPSAAIYLTVKGVFGQREAYSIIENAAAQGKGANFPGLEISVREAPGTKCPRCWMHSVDADPETGLCPRCAAVVKEL